METYLKPPIRSNKPFLASSVTEKTLVAHSEERLHAVLATLEACRTALVDSANRDMAQLVSVAILALRMKLHRVADAELKALCDALSPGDARAAGPQHSKSPYGERRLPFLKVIK
jgi:hypothetical protein